MRSEKVSDILEELESEHALALERNWESDYDPKRPWNAVWRRIVEGKREGALVVQECGEAGHVHHQPCGD